MLIGSIPRSLIHFRGPLIGALAASGVEVIGAAPGADDVVAAELEMLGARYEPIPMSRSGTNPVVDAAAYPMIRSMLRRIRPDVVIPYTAKPVIYGSLAARSAGGIRVCSLITGLGYAFSGNSPRQRILRALLENMYRISLASNHAVIFQNPDDRDWFVSRGIVPFGRTQIVNGSGVDLDHYRRCPLPDGPVSFLLAARLIAEKGIRDFVAAARLVRERLPATRFILLGRAEAAPSAITSGEIDGWVREGLVEYRGSLTDVRPVFEEAHAFVLPTYYREGTPRTILEALATGRAVITTDTPGCRETVIDGENGYLVPPHDPSALADAMLRLAQSPQRIREFGEAGHRMAVRKYDVRVVNDQIMSIIGIDGVRRQRQ